jgi:thiamine pyrophosphate-dependent acetolactate synthase large subunit-like protein
MRHLIAVVALLAVTSHADRAVPRQPAGPAQAASDTVSVQIDRSAIHSRLGGRFSFTSTVQNQSGRTKPGLIAHLNVFSTDPNTYVDPEDWSSHRTQFLDPLPTHGSADLTWTVQAVNSGSLILYVAVTDIRNHSVVVSGPIELTVTQQQSIDAAGILPMAVGVPAAVAVLLTLVRLRRRRSG